MDQDALRRARELCLRMTDKQILDEVAKSGDFNAAKAQLGETGKACKACHDKYRNK